MEKKLVASLIGLCALVMLLIYANLAPKRPGKLASAEQPPIQAALLAPALEPSPVAAPVPKPPTPQALPPNTYVVDRVIDGDTIVLNIRGTAEKVRLIGLDTPEVVDSKKPVQCYGQEASAEANAILDGKVVRFEADPTQGTYDVYHRLLGYVFLPDGTNVEEYMIKNGFGREYTYRLPYKYQKQFKAAQVQAKAAGVGLWSACAR